MKKYFIILFLILFLHLNCEREVSVSPPDPPNHISKLFIESIPSGAEIYINGRNTGQCTPDTINWLEPAAAYRMLLKLPLYKDTNLVVTASADSVRRYLIDFNDNLSMLGKIYIRTYPQGVTVLINDSVEVTAPVTVDNLVPGDYTMSFKKIGYWDEAARTVVKSAQVSNVEVAMTDTSEWIIYNPQRTGIPIDYIVSIAFEGNTKWISTSGNGLIKYDDQTWTVYNSANSPLPDAINSVAVSPEHDKWICTNSGIYLLDRNGGWSQYNTQNSGIASDFINCAAFANNSGAVYIGTGDKGFSVFNGSVWNNYDSGNSDLPSNQITSIIIDNLDTVWVGTLLEGVVKFKTPKFMYIFRKRYPPTLPYSAPFSNNNITAMKFNYLGGLWVGFGAPVQYGDVEGGIAVYNRSYWSRLNNPPFAVSSMDIFSEFLWFGQYENGVYVYNTKQFNWKHYSTANSPLSSNKIYAVAVDDNNVKYFGTFGGGLIKYKNKD